MLPGCEWPRDAGTTLHHVRAEVLRAGVTAEPPWVTVAEAVLVERLAARLGARIERYPGSESPGWRPSRSGLSMKAAWTEDMLGLVPPVAFLVAARYWTRPPGDRFPYGYHRSVSVGFLAVSFALLVLGYRVHDSLLRLVRAERAPNGIGADLWWGDTIAVRRRPRTARAAAAGPRRRARHHPHGRCGVSADDCATMLPSPLAEAGAPAENGGRLSGGVSRWPWDGRCRRT